ncbi:DUF5076 domain-containing protein [Planctomyces sp. SH-PL62]|uniref:DUF5076 domain-containing protein n=1 Tax=Planctomyces sp. SH-PL62 TaxID=1636152 RepID=UPI00078DDE60|nr:DUF5076 domain-containing protein [Planctomyces sp. SH-PL62]AMV40301.1 hypothetical protein VT85_22915 [Planctomyces sp. SH-PL62]
MSAPTGPLPPPAHVALDPRAVEIARVWITSEGQRASLAATLWDDPAAWGLMLVDLARQVAEAYAKEQGVEPEQALARIREGFDAEWDHPTDAADE